MRIDLGNGQWWNLKDELTRGDRRKIDEHLRRDAFKTLAELREQGMDQAELMDRVQAQMEAGQREGARRTISDEEKDFTLARATVAWSFPEPPGYEGVMERSEAHHRRAWAEASRLYGLDEDDGEGKSPSGDASPSLRSASWSPSDSLVH